MRLCTLCSREYADCQCARADVVLAVRRDEREAILKVIRSFHAPSSEIAEYGEAALILNDIVKKIVEKIVATIEVRKETPHE